MKYFFKIFFISSFFFSLDSIAQDFQNDYNDYYSYKSQIDKYQDYNNGYKNIYNNNVYNDDRYNNSQINKFENNNNIQDYPNKNLYPEYSNKNSNIQSPNNSINNYGSYQYNANSKNDYPKMKYQFLDGKGDGYRVYDNSNRQSYFCGLTQDKKLKFSHDNNFNGLYFGVGANFSSASAEFIENKTKNNANSVNYNYSLSANIINPSIIMGQGRLFSSGLFLGQEMSIVLGDISIKNKNITSNADVQSNLKPEISSVLVKTSNLSFYSGKFGVNIFKNYIPYLKLGISFGEVNYITEFNDKSKMITTGYVPSFVFGGGIDISLIDHLRIVIDHSIISNSINGGKNEFNDESSGIKTIISGSSNLNISRLNLVWRF